MKDFDINDDFLDKIIQQNNLLLNLIEKYNNKKSSEQTEKILDEIKELFHENIKNEDNKD